MSKLGTCKFCAHRIKYCEKTSLWITTSRYDRGLFVWESVIFHYLDKYHILRLVADIIKAQHQIWRPGRSNQWLIILL